MKAKSILYFSLLFFSLKPLGFRGGVSQGTRATMCNEGSVMKMESRNNHTLGHVKTQLEPECSECTWLLAVSRVKCPHYFCYPSVYPASISTLILDVFMSMMNFIDVHELFIHTNSIDSHFHDVLYWLLYDVPLYCESQIGSGADLVAVCFHLRYFSS